MSFAAPTMVAAALKRVQQEHPIPLQGEIFECARADHDAAALWNRLCAFRDERLDRALLTLEPIEERLLLYGAPPRLLDQGCVAVLARLFTHRQPSGRGLLAWEALVISNGDAAFRTSALEYARNRSTPPGWAAFAEAAQPLDLMLRSITASRVPLDQWLNRPENALSARPILVRFLKRKLLVPPYLSDSCQRETPNTLAEWANAVLLDDERRQWYTDFLLTTSGSGWDANHRVLEDICNRYGIPTQARPFWDELPLKVVEAVNLWLKDRELTDSLGVGDRLRFWRRFLPWIEKSFRSRSGDAVFICLDNWFAVQYREMGRATYMFENKHLIVLRRLDEPALYNRILRYHRAGWSIGRYEHRGLSWEFDAQREVMRVLKLYSKI